jgi:proteasome beta subunit
MSSAVSMTDPRRPIAGDFLSLLANHELRPFRGEVAGSAPTETQATTVLAFHFRDGVLVAGDRRATAGNVIVADSVDKVVDLDATSVLAVAGVPATAFEMARVLQNSFEYYRRSQLQPLSLPAKVRSVGRLLKENLPMTLQGVGVVVPLFVALDPAMTPPAPRIYFYDPLGAQFQAAEFAASGSGAGVVRSLMAFQTRFGSPKPSQMSLTEAVRFALRMLVTAAGMDSATGGVDPGAGRTATLRWVGPEGVRTIGEELQRAGLSDAD